MDVEGLGLGLGLGLDVEMEIEEGVELVDAAEACADYEGVVVLEGLRGHFLYIYIYTAFCFSFS